MKPPRILGEHSFSYSRRIFYGQRSLLYVVNKIEIIRSWVLSLHDEMNNSGLCLANMSPATSDPKGKGTSERFLEQHVVA